MPRGRILVKDTADVFYHFENGDTRYFGCMNTAGIEKTVDTEDIRCGIGWGLAAIMYSNPDMKLTFTPGFWNDYFLEDASGNEFADSGSVDVWTNENVTFAASSSDAVCDITGTPVGDVVKVQDVTGKMYAATYTGGTVTITGEAALDGIKGTVSYQKAVTADVLSFTISDNPKVHGITIKTIAYDPETNEIVAELYWTFDKVLGDGGLNLAIAGGTQSITEINARVLPTASGEFGKYITVEV